MSNVKLKDINEINQFNKELINELPIIDCSWFQNKAVSYDCCNTLAFLFRLGKLKDINNSEDLKIEVLNYRSDFKEMCEKDRDTDEKEWERIRENIQLFAFSNNDSRNYEDLLHLAKLIGIVLHISYPKDIKEFTETYQQPECQQIIKDLIANEQIQFTAKNVEYSCENYFNSFNAVLLDAVIKSLDDNTIKMNVF